jgi:putative flippase GtrA
VIPDRSENRFDTNLAEHGSSGFPRILHQVLRGHELRVLRFAFFGVLSGLLYASAVWVGVTKLGAMPLIMNVVGYLLVLPLNFLLNRNYTFGGSENIWRDAKRFMTVHILNISATSAVYVVADMVHAPLLVGVVGALVIVPITQYLALDRWVFRGTRVRTHTPE